MTIYCTIFTRIFQEHYIKGKITVFLEKVTKQSQNHIDLFTVIRYNGNILQIGGSISE